MLYAIIAAIILIGDQWLKYWVTVNITLSTGEAALIPGVVKLVNIHNTGAAFGLLGDASYARWLFLGVAAVFIIVIIVVLARHTFKSRFANWCAVLALAGAVGNCIDRALYGYVVDMFKVEFMDFAVFNIADVFLVLACIAFIIYLIVDIIRGGSDDDEDEDDDEEEEKPRRSERRAEPRAERKAERRTERKSEPKSEPKPKAEPKPERKAEKPVTDDRYEVSGIKTGSFEFPDTATPLVNDDKADEGDFWESFKFELRGGDESKAESKKTGKFTFEPADEPEVEPKPAPKPVVELAAEPKPAPKQTAAPKAKSDSEYDLDSILAEFKDL